MKVDLHIEDGKFQLGWIKSKPAKLVRIAVQFSDTELAAIKKLGLGEYVFFSFPIHPEDHLNHELWGGSTMDIKVKNLVSGKYQTPRYQSEIEAMDAMQKIANQFQVLKDKLLSTHTPTSTSFTL